MSDMFPKLTGSLCSLGGKRLPRSEWDNCGLSSSGHGKQERCSMNTCCYCTSHFLDTRSRPRGPGEFHVGPISSHGIVKKHTYRLRFSKTNAFPRFILPRDWLLLSCVHMVVLSRPHVSCCCLTHPAALAALPPLGFVPSLQ